MAAIEASLRLEIAQYQAALVRAEGEIQRFRQKAKREGGGLSKDLFGPLTRGAAALGATLGAYGVGRSMLEGVMSMERMEKMLVTTTGSAEAASARFEELREVAKLPGIGLEQAVQGDANLRAVGMSADMSKKAIVEFGNALALVGKGGADLDGVLLAITQISTKGKVFTEEINQIAERLPQTRAMLKEAFGTSSAEDIQKMGLSFEEFITRYLAAFETLARAQTGLVDDFEELADLGKEFSAAFAGPVVKEVLPALRGMAEELLRNKETFAALGTTGAEAVSGMLSGFRELGEAVNLAWFALGNFGETWELLRRGRFSDALENWSGHFELGAAALRDYEIERGTAAAVERKPVESEKPDTAIQRPAESAPVDAGQAGAQREALAEAIRLEGLRQRLEEERLRDYLSILPPHLKLLEIKRQIHDIEAEAGRAGPETEEARLRWEMEILDLKRQQRAAQEEVSAAAEREAETRQRQTAGMADILREMDILRAKAAGNQAAADKLREEAAIQDAKERFMREAGMDEADALKMARERAALERQIAAEREKMSGGGRYDAEGRRADGRRQIKGYSFERQGGADEAAARAGRRVDDARARVQADYDRAFPGLAGAPEFSGERLRDTFQFPGLEGAWGLARPLDQRASENAAIQDGGRGGGGVEGILRELLDVTSRGLLSE